MSLRSGASAPNVAAGPSNTVSGQMIASQYAPLAASAAFGKVLRQAVAAICVGNGFDTADPSVLELLTHAASAYMKEIAEGAQIITENSGRTKLVPADVWLSLVNMGHNVSQLPEYLKQNRENSIEIPPPKVATPSAVLNPLRVGSSRTHHPHIHDFFPPFPDPHTYLKSEISLEPDQSYERARDLLAQKKRESESSLTDFFLRTHQSSCVFREMEARIRNEARKMVWERMEREASRKTQRRALKRKRGGEVIEESVQADQLPDSLLEEEGTKNEGRTASVIAEDDEELSLDIIDTESSIVRRKIPAHCFVLDPTHEHRPYVSALMGDLQDDELEKAESKAKQGTPTSARAMPMEGESRGAEGEGGAGGAARGQQ